MGAQSPNARILIPEGFHGEFAGVRDFCVWQLLLARFGGSIWPTSDVVGWVRLFLCLPARLKDRQHSCENVGIPPLVRDFQGRWKEWETCSWVE
jgi:hypothetical protein